MAQKNRDKWVTVPDPNYNKKLGELVIYIAEKSANDDKFGSIKLNKILYYADFLAYRKLGKSISEDEYQHLNEGPAPRHLIPTRKQLLHDESISMVFVPYYGGVQNKIIPNRKPKLKGLIKKEELNIIDEVIEALWPLNGREVSEKSHNEFGWKITKNGDTIPYRTAWLTCEEPSLEQIELGLKLADKYGLFVKK